MSEDATFVRETLAEYPFAAEAFERILAAPEPLDTRIESLEQLEALHGALSDALSIVAALLGKEADVDIPTTQIAPPGRKEDAGSHFETRKAEREAAKLRGFPDG